MIQKLGEPKHASRISSEEAARYVDRAPRALIRFWLEHGRGAYFDGLYWLCDPEPFDSVLELIFNGDEEFSPSDMTVVAYTAFGDLKVWHRRRRQMNVSLLESAVFNPPASAWHDRRTGQPFSEDFSVSSLASTGRWAFGPEDHEFFAAAVARHGMLEPGEVYGFFPALQLGGAYKVENLKRVRAAEHFQILAQLDRFKLTRLTPPDPPTYPYGHVEFVRYIGQH
ncbi:GAD-like domain-containing protein [Bradyrhizobium sp. S3.12.5]|uniref:GAD-like domain-containing protein n=1 Tax=Bradyrhizobium sp. S3.12.5 TaxID=3156386 RepID=UPI003394B668